jgi:hypothetical protein
MYFLVFIKLFNTKKGTKMSILVASDPEPVPDSDPQHGSGYAHKKIIGIDCRRMFSLSSHIIKFCLFF